MKKTMQANRASHVKAHATNPDSEHPDGVIIEITTADPSGQQTVLPPFWLSRQRWAGMIALVDTAFGMPDRPRD